MKKLLITLPVALLFLTSCGGGACDPSTAEGAAKCYCELDAELDAAKEAGDDTKKDKLREEMKAFQKEAEKFMDDEVYTENDVEKIINETCEK